MIQAESGFQFMNGPPGGEAVHGVTKMPVALMDLLAAHQLKEALLVALWNRERTGALELLVGCLSHLAVAAQLVGRFRTLLLLPNRHN